MGNLLQQHDPRTVTHGQGRETTLSGERLLVCDCFRFHIPLAPGQSFPKNPGSRLKNDGPFFFSAFPLDSVQHRIVEHV